MSIGSLLTLKRIGCAFSLGILVVLVVGLVVYNRRLDARVQAALHALAASGAPVTLEDLDALYVVPDEENAAAGLEPVVGESSLVCPMDIAALPMEGDGVMPAPWDPIPDAILASIDEYVDLNREILDTARTASLPGRARWPVNFHSYSRASEHLGPVLRLVRAFELDALSRAAHGDSEGAVSDIETQARLIGCLADEPTVVAQIFRHTAIAATVDTAEQTVNRLSLSAGQLDRLGEVLDSIEPTGSMAHGLLGERCMVVDALRSATPEDYAAEGVPRLPGVVYRVLGLDDATLLNVLEAHGECIDVSRMPVEEQWTWVCGVKANGVPAVSPSNPHGIRTALSHMLASEPRAAARVRIAQVAVAAERYRADHGAYPDSPEDWRFQPPIDPFDGQPIRYRRESGGIVAYSVNANGVDDVGTERRDGESWRDGDVAFRIRRADE